MLFDQVPGFVVRTIAGLDGPYSLTADGAWRNAEGAVVRGLPDDAEAAEAELTTLGHPGHPRRHTENAAPPRPVSLDEILSSVDRLPAPPAPGMVEFVAAVERAIRTWPDRPAKARPCLAGWPWRAPGVVVVDTWEIAPGANGYARGPAPRYHEHEGVRRLDAPPARPSLGDHVHRVATLVRDDAPSAALAALAGQVRGPGPCGACDGRGRDAGSAGDVPCPACYGRGTAPA